MSGASGDSLRPRIIGILVPLVAANLLVWLWALLAFHDHPVLLGTALLAFTFGLRHAVDADHIAAIDNVTRKFMQDGQRPLAVGLFFSLGHATVVIAMSVGIAFAAARVQQEVESFRTIGGIVSTSVSAFFLFAIAALNIVILRAVYRSFQAVKRGERLVEEDLDLLLNHRGLIARLLRPLFRMVRHSWQMFPVGLLFGLGFDTATEVALFGISAAEAAKGHSLWIILVFPALFTAGMALVDTLDGILMVGAYGWAFKRPIRKLYYNLTITSVSVLVAVLIGSIETLGLIAEKLELTGAFWSSVAALTENFGLLGYLIIAIFGLSWLVSLLVYRLRGYDRIEAEFEPAGETSG
ncbi:HoxN/HupN/NixA family nickel/cobalt transporter [Dongia sedimenti]|uniref:Nickel/cobalt efflux system n=1 Tax=Dongia sedimenti TaxID=3064282 RepID=A0ABU0YUA5_9PROT|nr:HoxN/HupN/NixA family nickel/cobalt transporter [Rhodospirillaceae bacterium R-7]